MPLHDQRIAESPIFLDSIAGLQQMLGRVAVNYGQPPLKVVVVPSSFSQREIANATNNQWSYPFMAITLQQVSEDTQGYNNNLRRTGVSVPVNNKLLTYKLTPISANFRVRYFTQDNGDLLKFSTRWITRQKDAQFRVTNDKFSINIKVRLSKDLMVPEQDITDWGNVFQLETNCDISTYLGEVESNTRINQVNLTTNLWNSTLKTALGRSVRTIKINSKQVS